MDLNVSLWGFLTAAAYIIIFNFLCKVIVMQTGTNNPLSKAILFLNS